VTVALLRLAALSGCSIDDIQRWSQAGLLPADEHEAQQLERVRVLELLRDRGFDRDAVAASLVAQPGLLDRHIDAFAGEGAVHTLDEAAASVGLPLELAARLWEATTHANGALALDDRDVGSLAAAKAAIDAGLPPEGIIQLLRVYADATARIAEAEARLFHFSVHERLRGDGMIGGALAESTTELTDRLLPMVDPAVAYFHRRALREAVRADLALHVAEDAGLLTPGDTTGRVQIAIAFADLSRFTTLTSAMGDLAAAEVLDRFSALVRREVGTRGGRVVKQIGDEFMLVFPDPRNAVLACTAIDVAAAWEPAFLSTRIGIDHGWVLCREGDYIGSTVNLAARITGEAGAGQVLVSRAVHEHSQGIDGVEFTSVGFRDLKGIAEPVELFTATLPGRDVVTSQVDPVCGMAVSLDSAPARLSVGAETIVFCSQRCLRLFLGSDAT
jgi:adenylate cyclase